LLAEINDPVKVMMTMCLPCDGPVEEEEELVEAEGERETEKTRKGGTGV
jgi:hypothetical protein